MAFVDTAGAPLVFLQNGALAVETVVMVEVGVDVVGTVEGFAVAVVGEVDLAIVVVGAVEEVATGFDEGIFDDGLVVVDCVGTADNVVDPEG